jgi:drug/metabolite transporter (DMT)-like permease
LFYSIRQNHQLFAWILLLILSLIWGSSFILIKKGVSVFLPFQVAALRIFVAFLVQFPFALSKIKVVKSSLDWKYLVISGVLGNLLPSFLFAMAGAKIDSSLSGALNALTPIFTLITGWYFFRQSVPFVKTMGLIIGLLGSLLLILSRSSSLNVLNINTYSLLVILATLSYGTNINVLRSKLSHIPSLYISFLSSLPIGIFTGVILLFSDIELYFSLEGSWQAAGYVAVLGIFGTAVGTILFNQLIKISSSLFASSVTYFIPIVALFWGWLDGEQLNVSHFIGIVIVLLGVVLVSSGHRIGEAIKIAKPNNG